MSNVGRSSSISPWHDIDLDPLVHRIRHRRGAAATLQRHRRGAEDIALFGSFRTASGVARPISTPNWLTPFKAPQTSRVATPAANTWMGDPVDPFRSPNVSAFKPDGSYSMRHPAGRPMTSHCAPELIAFLDAVRSGNCAGGLSGDEGGRQVSKNRDFALSRIGPPGLRPPPARKGPRRIRRLIYRPSNPARLVNKTREQGSVEQGSMNQQHASQNPFPFIDLARAGAGRPRQVHR